MDFIDSHEMRIQWKLCISEKYSNALIESISAATLTLSFVAICARRCQQLYKSKRQERVQLAKKWPMNYSNYEITFISVI